MAAHPINLHCSANERRAALNTVARTTAAGLEPRGSSCPYRRTSSITAGGGRIYTADLRHPVNRVLWTRRTCWRPSAPMHVVCRRQCAFAALISARSSRTRVQPSPAKCRCGSTCITRPLGAEIADRQDGQDWRRGLLGEQAGWRPKAGQPPGCRPGHHPGAALTWAPLEEPPPVAGPRPCHRAPPVSLTASRGRWPSASVPLCVTRRSVGSCQQLN